MASTYQTWHGVMLESDGTERLPIMRHPPVRSNVICISICASITACTSTWHVLFVAAPPQLHYVQGWNYYGDLLVQQCGERALIRVTHRSQTSPALVFRAHVLKDLARMQVSGLNLLKYNAGKHGAPLYHRYLRGMYQIIHKNGGGLAYYGKVCQKKNLNPQAL